MIARLQIRALPAALALIVSLAALLALPARTLAQAHKSRCSTTSSTASSKRGVHACTGSRHKAKPHHHKAKRHRASRHGKATPSGQTSQTPASCEDGSAPIRAKKGPFSCDDGSEPECEGGITPTRVAGGKSLVCVAPGEGSGEAECKGGAEAACSGSSATAAVCEDNSAPAADVEGAFSCDDGSEPACELGTTPMRSSDGSSLLCVATAGEERES